jgi:AP-1-like factor
MLEAKTDTQAAENENLRELLTRLQNENVQLKQAQFNFTFQQSPPSADGSGAGAAGPSAAGHHPSQPSQSPTEPVLTQNPTPPTSKPTPYIHLFDTFSPNESFSSFGISPPPTTNVTANATTSGNDLSWLNMFNTFPGVTNGSSPNSAAFNGGGMPYQTIASNPMFTSFREPTPNAWASFGAGPVDVNMDSYDELFGGGGAMNPSQGLGSSMEDLLTFNPFLPDATGSSIISPLSQHVTPPALPETNNRSGSTSGLTVNGTISNNGEASTSGSSSGQPSPHSAKECPKSKSDFEAMIKKNSQDTFGPPVSTPNPMEDNGLRCIIIPADPTKVNLDLGTAWKAVRQHPQFEVSPSQTPVASPPRHRRRVRLMLSPRKTYH